MLLTEQHCRHISLFECKTSAAALLTKFSWTPRLQKLVLAVSNRTELVLKQINDRRGKWKSRKVRKWEQQAVNRPPLGKAFQPVNTWRLKANSTSSRPSVRVGRTVQSQCLALQCGRRVRNRQDVTGWAERAQQRPSGNHSHLVGRSDDSPEPGSTSTMLQVKVTC